MYRHWRGGIAARLILVSLVTLLLSIRPSVAGAASEYPPAPAIETAAFLAQGHFVEPLIAMAPTTADEDRALARALADYDQRREVGDWSALTGFLARFPDSGWRAALLVNLGLEYKHYGYLSRALDAFEEAWRVGKSASGTYQKPLVDRAVGELALLHAQLGHAETVKALLAEIAGRPVANPGGEWLQMARETLWVMENDPKHLFLCGPLALKFLMMENPATTPEQVEFVNRYHAGPKGVSLAEVARLANEAKVSLTPVFRKPGEPVPAPSIVHWKTGHFAAILGRENGGYRIKDPVLGRNARWAPAEAVEEEASGYFLAEAGDIQKAGWRKVDAEEAGQVFGAGPTQGPDPDDPGPPADPPPCSSCPCPMCGYNISELGVAVSLSDQPVGYTPAIGPSATFTISYNQREADQPAVFKYFNVSPNWTTNWLRFIQDDPANVGQSVMRYRADGSAWLYSGYNGGVFAPEESDASVLVLQSTSPITYQRSLRDGSVEVYSQSDGSTSYPRNVFLTKIVDPQGNALKLNYTIAGGQVKLASLTDATGRNTTFTYGSSASPLLITAITDPFGRSATLTYDGGGSLKSITDVLGLTSSFTYDSSGLVNSLTTPYGTTLFAYGGAGNTRFVDVTDPLGIHEREESLQPASVPSSDPVAPSNMNVFNAYLNYRDSFHWDKHEYAQAGCTVSGGCNYSDARDTHFYHDAANINIEWYQVEAVKQPLETRVWYNYPGQSQNLNNGTYDQPSVVGRIADGNVSQLWQRSYNAFGNPTQVIDPAGRTSNLVYATNGTDLTQLQQVTGSGPQTTASYSYNSQHLPLTYTDAAGQVTHYAYNAAGRLTQLSLPTGLVWNFAYDGFGRITTITNPNGHLQASYTYDGFDRVKTAMDSEGYTLTYAYDAADRLTQITYPDGTSRAYAYDKLDLASATDRQGRTTKYSYDADRRLIGTMDPLRNVTRYAYWENGQLKSLADPKGNVTSWAIDLEGRTAVKQYADGSQTVYGYDDAGRLDSIRDALGQIKQYSYTIDNRIAGIAYSYAANPTPGVAFGYDPYFPRLIAMRDGTGTTSYVYGAVGALGALQLQSEAGGPTGPISYSYDALGRTIGRTVAGFVETFGYDGLNRLISHTDPLGQFALTYLGQTGQITGRSQTSSADFPAQTAWSYLANSGDRRLAGIANTGMRQFSYTTTPEDLITRTVETGSRSWDYGYDADNRLTSANYSTGPQFGSTFDPDGNIIALRRNSGTTFFTYDNLNELKTVNYTYDANGNLLFDGLRTYAYDAENRLVGIAYRGTSNTTKFAYDGLGRRVEINDAGSPAYFQWCGSQICRQLSGTGATLRLYYDEGERLATGQSLYYGPDQLGSPRNFAVVTGTNATVETLDFNPFGNAMTAAAGPLPDFGFAGMFYHGASGLYLTQYRGYDPRTARWLSRDPLEERIEEGPGDPGGASAAGESAPQTTALAAVVPDFTQLAPTPPGGDAATAAPDGIDPAQAPFGGPATVPGVPDFVQDGPAERDGFNLYLYVSDDPVNLVDPLGLNPKNPPNHPGGVYCPRRQSPPKRTVGRSGGNAPVGNGKYGGGKAPHRGNASGPGGGFNNGPGNYPKQ
jgi:RHS repeat-associated protein